MITRETTGRARVSHCSLRVVALVAAGLGGIAAPAAAAPLLPRPAAIEGAAGTSWQQPVTVKATFRSARLGPSTPTTARVLLIGGKPGSSLRYRLGTLDVPALELGATKQLTTTLTPPQRLRAASYRLAICVGRYPKTRCRTSTAITLRVPPATLSEPITTPTPTPNPTPSPTPSAPGKLTASATALAFGTLPAEIGETVAGRYQRTIELTNTGDSPLPALTLPAAPLAGTPFSLTSTTCRDLVLAPAQRCTVTFAVSPEAGKAAGAEFIAAAGTQSVAIALSVTGAAGPTVRFKAKPKGGIAFGDLYAGESSTKTLTVENTGDMPQEQLALTRSGPQASAGSLTNDTCSGRDLAPGASCTVDVTYRVPATQSAPEFWSFALTVGGLWPQGTDGVKLNASVHGPKTDPELSLSAATATTSDAIDLGQYSDPAAVAPTTITVYNRGTVASGVPTITIPTGFTATDGTTCGSGVVGDGGTCTVVIAPSATGWQNLAGDLTIDAGAAGGLVTVSLSAKARVGAMPKLQLTKGDGAWGRTTIGRRIVRTLEFTNTGGSPLPPGGYKLIGGDSSFSFAELPTSCDRLAPGATCTIKLDALAADAADHTNTLRLTLGEDQGLGIPDLDIPLSITGVSTSAYLFLESSKVMLSQVLTSSVERLRNPTDAVVHNVSVQLDGGDLSVFGLINDGCSGRDLAPNSFCDVTVTFTPPGLGLFASALNATGEDGFTSSRRDVDGLSQ